MSLVEKVLRKFGYARIGASEDLLQSAQSAPDFDWSAPPDALGMEAGQRAFGIVPPDETARRGVDLWRQAVKRAKRQASSNRAARAAVIASAERPLPETGRGEADWGAEISTASSGLIERDPRGGQDWDAALARAKERAQFSPGQPSQDPWDVELARAKRAQSRIDQDWDAALARARERAASCSDQDWDAALARAKGRARSCADQDWDAALARARRRAVSVAA